MDKNIYSKTMQKVEKIEKEFGSLEDFVILSTMDKSTHRMIVEDATFDEMGAIYQDLSDLEIADLLDYQNLMGSKYGEYF